MGNYQFKSDFDAENITGKYNEWKNQSQPAPIIWVIGLGCKKPFVRVFRDVWTVDSNQSLVLYFYNNYGYL